MARNSEGQFEGVLAIQWKFINDKKMLLSIMEILSPPKMLNILYKDNKNL